MAMRVSITAGYDVDVAEELKLEAEENNIAISKLLRNVAREHVERKKLNAERESKRVSRHSDESEGDE